MNKEIKRGEGSVTIFNDRTLAQDYATLLPLLRPGLQVLDVGCGTAAISKDIAERIGPTGSVTGIDYTARFIEIGQNRYKQIPNLKLIHADLFEFTPNQAFDLIVSARTLQWLRNPDAAIQQFKTWLKPGGLLSILDYNHSALQWQPAVPQTMQHFYNTWLQWRADAGMNNHMADALPKLFEAAGFQAIEVYNADEAYQKGLANFEAKLSIWSAVAASTQLVEEGYLSDRERLQALADYTNWIEKDAEQMVMQLREVRGHT